MPFACLCGRLLWIILHAPTPYPTFPPLGDKAKKIRRMLKELPRDILKQLLPDLLGLASELVERPEARAQLQELAEHSRSADRLQVYQAASQTARAALVAPTRAQDRLSAPLPDGRIQEVRPQIAPDLASKLRGRWHACALKPSSLRVAVLWDSCGEPKRERTRRRFTRWP